MACWWAAWARGGSLPLTGQVKLAQSPMAYTLLSPTACSDGVTAIWRARLTLKPRPAQIAGASTPAAHKVIEDG